jgi:hypothetical protein
MPTQHIDPALPTFDDDDGTWAPSPVEVPLAETPPSPRRAPGVVRSGSAHDEVRTLIVTYFYGWLPFPAPSR